jgi:hypothetical protein
MTKKIIIALFINLIITVILYYTATLLGYNFTKFYIAKKENDDYFAWIGVMIVCFFLLNLLISYFILRVVNMVTPKYVILFFAEVVLVRVVLVTVLS